MRKFRVNSDIVLIIFRALSLVAGCVETRFPDVLTKCKNYICLASRSWIKVKKKTTTKNRARLSKLPHHPPNRSGFQHELANHVCCYELNCIWFLANHRVALCSEHWLFFLEVKELLNNELSYYRDCCQLQIKTNGSKLPLIAISVPNVLDTSKIKLGLIKTGKASESCRV